MWEVIRELVQTGATVLLTTQYLEEADRLADNIVVMDRGQVIAQGSADALKAQIGGEQIELVVEKAGDLPLARALLGQLAVGEVQSDEHSRKVTAPVNGGAGALMTSLRALDANNVAIFDVGLRRPTLDDVFLTLTGHTAESDRPDGDSAEQSAQGDGAAPRHKGKGKGKGNAKTSRREEHAR
jgi:ABC-2 type transport system ATP-binding protein